MHINYRVPYLRRQFKSELAKSKVSSLKQEFITLLTITATVLNVSKNF